MAKEDDKKVEQTSEKETTDTKDTKEQEPAPDEGDGGSSDTASSDDAAGSTEGEDGKTKEEDASMSGLEDGQEIVGEKSAEEIQEAAVEEATSERDLDMVDLGKKAAMTAGESFLIGKITGGHYLIGAGIALAGQQIGILPTSIKDAVGKLANLSEFALGPDANLTATLKSTADSMGYDPNVDGKTLLGGLINTINKSGQEDSEVVQSMVDEGMTYDEAGKELVASGALVDAADPESTAVPDVSQYSSELIDGIGQTVDASAKDAGGALTEDQKKNFAASYMNYMYGMNQLYTSANEEIASKYADDMESGDKASMSLESMMDGTVNQQYTAMMEMNDKYDFLSDKDKENMANLDIAKYYGADFDYDESMYAEAEAKDEDGKDTSDTGKGEQEAALAKTDGKSKDMTKQMSHQDRVEAAESISPKNIGVASLQSDMQYGG